MRQVLVVIDADPRSSDRAVEGLRMAVGLSLGANRIALFLTGEGRRLLDRSEVFDDDRRAREYLEVLEEAGVSARTDGDLRVAADEAEVVIRWGE